MNTFKFVQNMVFLRKNLKINEQVSREYMDVTL